MSETKPRNTQAFPVPGSTYDSPGMTLRDYFAAKAETAIMAAKLELGWSYEEIAITTYAMADAMLRAREAKP